MTYIGYTVGIKVIRLKKMNIQTFKNLLLGKLGKLNLIILLSD